MTNHYYFFKEYTFWGFSIFADNPKEAFNKAFIAYGPRVEDMSIKQLSVHTPTKVYSFGDAYVKSKSKNWLFYDVKEDEETRDWMEYFPELEENDKLLNRFVYWFNDDPTTWFPLIATKAQDAAKLITQLYDNALGIQFREVPNSQLIKIDVAEGKKLVSYTIPREDLSLIHRHSGNSGSFDGWSAKYNKMRFLMQEHTEEE